MGIGTRWTHALRREEASAAKKPAKSAKLATDLPFEAQLWKAADTLRNNMDSAEYKHVVLGLIFLKYISDAFEEHHTFLASKEQAEQGADPEDEDEYKAKNIFWVPPSNHRPDHRQRHGGHRARKPFAQGRAPQENLCHCAEAATGEALGTGTGTGSAFFWIRRAPCVRTCHC